jgi:hypothetical protein
MAITTRSARFLDGPASEDRRVGPGAYDISGAGLTGSKLRPRLVAHTSSPYVAGWTYQLLADHLQLVT